MSHDVATILVVDDVAENREILTRRLIRQGYRVLEAENGRLALTALSENSVDLVLLDILMPEMDGFTVLARMRDDKALSDVPVLVISAVDDKESVVRCINLGATDHLPKPFESAILNARVSSCLEQKRLRDTERELMKALEEEKARSESLLLNVLPAPIAERLKQGEREIAESHACVTVMFADIVGFKKLSAQQSPIETSSLLGRLFTRFDGLALDLGVEKIKTIGDAYMAVAGLPPNVDHHADNAVRMASEMVQTPMFEDEAFELRVGLHSGPVAAGVIGHSKFCYDVWGETVNVAYVVEQHGSPGRVHLSHNTAELLGERFALIPAESPLDESIYAGRTYFVDPASLGTDAG